MVVWLIAHSPSPLRTLLPLVIPEKEPPDHLLDGER